MSTLCALAEMGSSPFLSSYCILLLSPPDPVKSMMDSNLSKVTQSRLFGQRNLVKVRVKFFFFRFFISVFFVMFEDGCLCN